MSKWRPIETAERTEDRRLIRTEGDGIEIGHWSGVGWSEGWYRDATAEYDNDFARIEGAKWWMPFDDLPDPPQDRRSEG